MWTLLRAWFALVVCIAEELAEVALDSDLDAECQPSDPSNPSDDASTSCGTLSLAQLRAKALAKDTRGSQTLENCEMSDRMQIRWTADPTLCLSSEGNRIGNGIRMQLWKCDETWSSPGQIFKQQLLRWAADERIRMAFNPEYCVVVDNDDFKNGAKIQLWKCDDSNEMQDWVLWNHFGGSCSGMIAAQATDKKYCMVVDGNNGFDGAKVQLWKCAGDQYAKTWSPWTQEA